MLMGLDLTPLRARNPQKFYDYAPVETQFQSGDGSALPGNWKGLTQTEITKPLTNPPRGPPAQRNRRAVGRGIKS